MSSPVFVPFDELFKFFGERPPKLHSTVANIAGVRITAECDDLVFFPDFYTLFGGSSPAPGKVSTPGDLHVEIHSRARPDFGWFRMSGSNDLPVDAQEFRFDLDGREGTFERLRVDGSGWNCIGFRGSGSPAYAFRDRDCIFALGPRWRGGIVRYLLWRLLRMRSDAIFFHASALGILGAGTIFVGPSESGKSTISLALAARGHDFLGDDIVGYIPARNELIPFRRPVGIKPGLRAKAVERGLTAALKAQIEREGYARVDIGSLFPVGSAMPVRLKRIVFLRGFAARPRLEPITPGREEIIELQPLMSSFLNASHTRRVFELARMLSGARAYQLELGEPDSTADYLEERFAHE